jgi:lysyl-tRNA synthetase class 2
MGEMRATTIDRWGRDLDIPGTARIRMDERLAREAKLQALRDAGIDPFPPRMKRPRTHTIAEALADFDTLAEAKTPITLAGRIVLFRDMGKICFAHLEDGTGRVQIYFRRDDLGEAFALIKQLDLGDFIEATGFLFVTRTGERTLHVTELAMLAKSLRGLPAKHEGLRDVELRHRKRYLDLIANREDVLPVFVARAQIVASIRRYLEDLGYIEVETPILQPLYGGATARPFVTHHNTLDRDFYLRIAPELYLKRLLVGGIERVYEIARVFRNEGIDREHNPEFTMLEFYEAYADYHTMMDRTEQMVAYVAERVLGRLTVTWQGVELNLAPPWRRITLRDAIKQYVGIDIDEHPTREGLLEAIQARDIHVDRNRGRGRLIDELKDEMFRSAGEELLQPIILYDFPIDLSPLTKQKPGTPGTVERFQVHLAGTQLVTSFTELNDPHDQRARFEDQARQRALGDDEAQALDEDYIEALEVGMPPAGGVGLGIDRLVMALTDQSNIREVILFPSMREADKASQL